MAGRGKRRQRRRLIRWAAPLLEGGEDHDGDGCECGRCQASRYLQPEDWEVLDFYRHVWDQVENLTPMGTKDDGKPWLTPRLADWLAACDIYDVPLERRRAVIEGARVLRAIQNGQERPEYGLFRCDPRDLLPPPEP